MSSESTLSKSCEGWRKLHSSICVACAHKIGQDFVVQNLDYLNYRCNFGMRTYFLENHFAIDGTGESCCSREEGGVSS